MSPEVSNAILNMLRDARALAYRDSESFAEAVAVLEHAGQLIGGEVRSGLGEYGEAILNVAEQVPNANSRELHELFKTIKDARNDSVHTGAFIRHHTLRLVELLLVLEEAISMNGRVASDLMVRNPLTAELWHNIATVRRNMLTNSFSALPIKVDGKWKLISDRSLVAYLRGASNTEKRRRLGVTLESLIQGTNLTLEDALTATEDTPIDEVKKNLTHQPVLILDSAQNLVGILSSFDLL
jgi:CBS domain-containing protein